MGRGRAERATLNVIELRRAQRAIESVEERERVERVVEDLREDAGPSLARAAAARVLGVSRNTLNKWVERGMVPTNGRGVDRAAVEEIAAEVNELRALEETRPGVLAEALTRLADRDPELVGLEKQVDEGLDAVRKGDLVPLRIPENFGPDD